MSRLHQFEAEAQQAILRDAVTAYLRDVPHWRQEPALRRAVIIGALRSPAALGAMSLTGVMLVVAVVLFRATPVAAGLAGGVTLLAGIAALGGWLWLAVHHEQRWLQVLAIRLEPQARFAPGSLRDRGLQQRLYRALHAWGLAQQAAMRLPAGVAKTQALASCRQTTGWLASAYALAAQADELQWEAALAHRLQPGGESPASRQVRRQLIEASNRLDNTVAGLQALHSELLLMAGSGKQSPHVVRLESEIGEEVARLQDLTAAMQEVYNGEL